MGQLHNLVIRHGRQEARKRSPLEDRNLVDIAAAVLEEESQALGITYSGFCLTALPHKKLPDDQVWERVGHRLTMSVEPGWMRVNGKNRLFGVPYGSRARMMLLYLQTKAIQNNSPVVELGKSMYDWLGRMGIPVGGKTYAMVREQANRISACNLTFYWDDDHQSGFEKDAIIKGGIRLRSGEALLQGELWEDTVRLSETFFRALKDHPVPIWEPALRHISNRSMAIDVYIWLAYRLHALSGPTSLSWSALYQQFGAGFAALKNFKPKFREAVKVALAVYPEAIVDMDEKKVTLYPSKPPIDHRRVVALPALGR